MKKPAFKPQLVLHTSASVLVAGLLASGLAVADTPYSAWQSDDDTKIQVSDSFNPKTDTRYSKTVTEDNDYTLRKMHKEDNDITLSSDDDYTDSSSYRTTWTNTEDNDVTKSWQKSEDNDVAVDFQIATPTQSSYKHQDQDAGHQGANKAVGLARGHEVYTQGGPTNVSAGNDETYFMGPAMVNTNVNQVPVNHVNIGGSNSAPIGLSNTMAGRDMGDKGVFAPIGNTSVGVGGNVGNQSGATLEQSGAASNDIADPISSTIRQ